MLRPSTFEELIERHPNQQRAHDEDLAEAYQPSHFERTACSPTERVFGAFSKMLTLATVAVATSMTVARLLVYSMLGIMLAIGSAAGQPTANGSAATSGRTIEIRARSELRVTTRANGLSFIITGKLIDDRGTGLGDEEVAVTLSGSGDRDSWREAVATASDGTFRLSGSVASGGDFQLRAIWDGNRLVDGTVQTELVELKRRSVVWRVETPLLVPTQGDQTLREGRELVVLATFEADSAEISLTGSCFEGGAFDASFPIPRETGEAEIADHAASGSAGDNIRTATTDDLSDEPDDSTPRQDSNVATTLSIARTDVPFEAPCDVVASVEETATHDAESRTIEIIPVTTTLQLDFVPVSRPWSREQVYDVGLRTDRHIPLSTPASFQLRNSATTERSRPRLEGRWDLASDETVFPGVSGEASDELIIRVQHVDAVGSALWWSDEIQISTRGPGDSLRRGLLIFVGIGATLALVYALWIAGRKYLGSSTSNGTLRKRALDREDDSLTDGVSKAVGSYVHVRDSRSGWSIRDAWVRRQSSTHYWSGSQQRPGVVELPETARGMSLTAGAPGYFESSFRYDGGESELSLRPSRQFVHERVAALFAASGAPEFEKEAEWGTAPPRQVLFSAIRRRYPLWSDALKLDESTRPVDVVRSNVASADSESRLSVPNVLGLAALLLETAMLAPSTPEDVPELLDALDRMFAQEGL